MTVVKRAHRLVSVALVALLAATLGVTFAGTAAAAGTVLFDQPFANNTPSGTGAVVKPAPTSGTNGACLTATGNAATGVLKSCPPSTVPAPTVNDAPESGTLSLTPLQTSKSGGVFAATSVPTSQGLDVTFDLFQYGGGSFAADGIAFALSAVDPANPTAPMNMGPTGGSLGYSTYSTLGGLANAYLGVGFDVYGNFSSKTYQGGLCPSSILVKETGRSPSQVLVRGPGHGTVGYCALTGTGTIATPPVVPLHGVDRTSSKVAVEIVVNPNKTSIITASSLTVPAESFLVAFTPAGGGAQRLLTAGLPVMSATMVGAASWLDADGLPKQLAFGWVGSTGANIDNHEVANVKVSSLASVDRLTVSQLNYTPAAATVTTALPTGSPVSYVVTPGVSGLADAGPISVTETVPVGVRPLAATGTGWVCASPVGQTITCSNANGPFPAGTTLPTVTVSAVVTGINVSQSVVQASSVVTASSDTGLAGYSTASTTAANPPAPAITALSPVSGLVAGGNSLTITGTDLTGATSIQIGTAAEVAAGAGFTLLPCPTVPAPGCFTVSGSTLVISSMPAHPVGVVNVKVVNLGAVGTATYSYMSVPANPVVTATAGGLKATVNWSGSDGGSPITGYTVTPYVGAVAQTALVQNLAAGVSSFVFSPLPPGTSYTFQVVATNGNGSSAAGISSSVTPYTTPGAPQNPIATASTGQAIVSWTAPSSNGASTITGYTVTPSLAGVAQTPRVFASAALGQTVTGLTAGGSYTFTVKATNAAGTGLASAATAAVVVNAAPTLALATPVSGEVGATYTNAAFTATGGTGPFSWVVETGSLPAGLSLSTAGAITGTPTAAGIASFTVKVTDAAGQTASQALTLTVIPAPVLANPPAPTGQIGVGYSDQLSVQDGTGTGPFSWSLSSGELPGGMTLGPTTGLTSGTPTATGTFAFTVRVTDAKLQTATQILSISVTPSPTLSFPAPPGGQVGVAYSDPLVVTGGTGPYVWSATGALPAGLTLDPASGLLAGTPSAAGTFPVVVRVQDSRGQSATQDVTLVIAASPSLIFTPPAGEVGAAYVGQPVLSGGTGPFTFSLSTGTLPAGLGILPATGAITGTPTAPGNPAITVEVVDSFGQSAAASGTIVIAAAPTLGLPVPPIGDVGQAYSNQLTVTGGTGPFAWSIPAGTLPAGLALNDTGLVSGTPTTAGSFAVTVQVMDSFGVSATAELTTVIRVNASVSLDVSTTSTTLGGSVVLTATVGPAGSTGTVAFTETITTGPKAGSSATLGEVPVGTDGTAAIAVTLGAFGAHQISATYGGDGEHSAAATPATTVEVVATPGSILVSEFRLSGPSGAGDQYVELANVSPNAVALEGFQVTASSGAVTTLPNDVLPSGRSYLVTGTGFSLGAVAHSDYAPNTDLGVGGVAVLAPDTIKTLTDAVGPDIAGYHLGASLPAFSAPPDDQYAWVRTQVTSYLRNTQNNATDFALVSGTGGLVGGVQSMLGSASPTGLTDAWMHTFVARSSLLDPGVAVGSAPNRVMVKIQAGTPGALTVRRVITNTTSGTITAMKTRLHSISEANGLGAGWSGTGVPAEIRAVNPVAPTTTIQVAGSPVTVQNLSVDAPVSSSPGGGLNTTSTVPLPSGELFPGQSVAVAFTFATDKAGTFWFGYDVDTLGLG